jgi:hypothetical protein
VSEFFVLFYSLGSYLLQKSGGGLVARIPCPAGPLSVGACVVLVVGYPVFHHFSKLDGFKGLLTVLVFMVIMLVMLAVMVVMVVHNEILSFYFGPKGF